MATGDVVMKDWIKMLGREFATAGILGLTMAIAVSGISFFRGGPEVAMVVAISMVMIVIIGSVIGMSLPFILARFKLDPATASAPLVTSISDAVGILIYLSIATAMLRAPAAG
jgi:magnesium transporter